MAHREMGNEQERYNAVVTALNEGIGRVLDALGLARNTLVILFSDNGAFMLEGRGLEVASNKPLRDGGVTLWEGGIRVPCVVRWPGVLPAGTVCDEPFFSCDFFPMIARAAGARLPNDRVIDGRDPIETLAGKGRSPHDALFFEFRKYSAVRSGRYKLLRISADAPRTLFDLQTDIGEVRDIAAEHPETVARLGQAFAVWAANVIEQPNGPVSKETRPSSEVPKD